MPRGASAAAKQAMLTRTTRSFLTLELVEVPTLTSVSPASSSRSRMRFTWALSGATTNRSSCRSGRGWPSRAAVQARPRCRRASRTTSSASSSELVVFPVCPTRTVSTPPGAPSRDRRLAAGAECNAPSSVDARPGGSKFPDRGWEVRVDAPSEVAPAGPLQVPAAELWCVRRLPQLSAMCSRTRRTSHLNLPNCERQDDIPTLEPRTW